VDTHPSPPPFFFSFFPPFFFSPKKRSTGDADKVPQRFFLPLPPFFFSPSLFFFFFCRHVVRKIRLTLRTRSSLWAGSSSFSFFPFSVL